MAKKRRAASRRKKTTSSQQRAKESSAQSPEPAVVDDDDATPSSCARSEAKRHPSDVRNSHDAAADNPGWEQMHIWQIQAVRDLLVVAAGVGIIAAGYALRTVTVPLLIALLLAYLFEPLIARLSEHPRITRARAVGGLIITAGALLAMILAIAIPLALTQTADLIDDVNSGKYRDNVSRIAELLPADAADAFDRIVEYIPGLAPDEPSVDGPGDGVVPDDSIAGDQDDPAVSDVDEGRSDADQPLQLTAEELDAYIAERLRGAQQRTDSTTAAQGAAGPGTGTVLGFVQKGATAVWSVLARVISAGLIAFLIPFYFFFFSLWYPDVLRFAREMLPKANRRELLGLIAKMDRVVAGFVRGRIVISLIMGVLLSIGWAFMGVPYPIVTGMVVGVFCAVPYLGGIGVPLAVGLLLVDQFGLDASERMPLWLIFVGPTGVFAIVQVIEGYVLTPTIAGKATNLDPVTIVVAVLAGGSVLGIYGMLLAIPLAACGKIIATDVMMPRIRAWLKGELKDPLPLQRS